VNAAVNLCEGEPAACMGIFVEAGARNHHTQDPWALVLGWQWQAVRCCREATHAGVQMRQWALESLMSELVERRAASADAALARRVEELQQHQHAAQIQEQKQLQAEHEERLKRFAQLRRQRMAVDVSIERRKVCCCTPA
jgi:hypothetical protein